MADSDLSRTHPLTVAVKTLRVLGQSIGAAIMVAIFGSVGSDGNPLAALGIAALIVLGGLGSAGVQWLNWTFFRYGVVGNDLVINEGWLVRKRRSIPLARVQSVDVRAGVLLRIFGLVDLAVQTAGGSGTEPEANIGALSEADGSRLRERLLQEREVSPPADALRTDGAESPTPYTESPTPEPAFEFQMSVKRLVLAAVTSRGVLVIAGAILAGGTQFLDFAVSANGLDSVDVALRPFATLGIALTAALIFAIAAASVLVAIAVTVSRDYGFTARRTRDRIEIGAGLLERRMVGVPVRRVQATTIDEVPLRRLLGLVTVHVVTAGSGRGDEQESTNSVAIIPLARRDELTLLLRGLLPETLRFPATASLPNRSLRFYLTIPVLSAGGGTALLIGLARYIEPAAVLFVSAGGGALLTGIVIWQALVWRHAGYGTDSEALGIAHGAIGRYRVRLARSRIQSLSIRQNPFQRRAGLATLVATSVSGSSRALHTVRHLEVADAQRIAEWYSHKPL